MPFLARSPNAPPIEELAGSDIVTLNGLQLTGGQPDEMGIRWRSGTLQGWSSPGGTGGMDQRSRDHGGWAKKQFLTPRGIAIEGTAVSRSHVALHRAEDALIVACALDLVPLVVEQAGMARQSLVRRDGPVLWEEITPGVAKWSIQLVAPDPRKYGPERRYSTGLPSSVGGLSVPFTVPLTVDAVVTTGSFTVVNGGNFETPGRLVVRGPVQDPRITAVVDGRERTLAWDLTLGATDWLDIDLDRRTAYQNGTASRIGSMTSRQWWKFPFGTTEVGFNASTYSQGASLDALVKPAWM